jgi:hypothetical protein
MIWAGGLVLGSLLSAAGQIDPAKRELIQLGYNQPVEGQGPLAAYGYYLLNKPAFLSHSNLTLRLAVAPVYLDSELGVRALLGPSTDVGFGLAGGGFADSYSELRQGKFYKDESFFGSGGEASASVYHLFNPAHRIPLYAVLRGAVHGTVYSDTEDTADDFRLPPDQVWYRTRLGLRWGGREPVMMPDMAMEVSAWFESDFRMQPGGYGFPDDPRTLNSSSQKFLSRALLAYTLPEWKHNFTVTITGGTGWNQDRFSAFRLGGNLPLASEFPLALPGYYFQELSAESFALIGASYVIPLDRRQLWRLGVLATTAYVDYLPGLEQPRNWNTGVAGSVVFRSPSDSWQVAVAYGYGFDAIRSHGYGAQSLTFLLQFDLGRTLDRFYDPNVDLNRSRGLQGIFRTLFR